jgi:S-methylmethionine-dependent homocysteine/selenocysteine methylase
MTTLQQRLDRKEIIILDGAIGTELQQRGVPMDASAWCATAMKSRPHIVREVHEDYIRAGADVITANTFSTARHALEVAGLGDEVDALNRQAVELAREARD